MFYTKLYFCSFISQGAIEDIGTYDDLMKSEKEFTTLLTDSSAEENVNKDTVSTYHLEIIIKTFMHYRTSVSH